MIYLKVQIKIFIVAGNLPTSEKLVAAFLRVRFWLRFKPFGYFRVARKNDIFSNEVTLLEEITFDKSAFKVVSFSLATCPIWKLN